MYAVEVWSSVEQVEAGDPPGELVREVSCDTLERAIKEKAYLDEFNHGVHDVVKIEANGTRTFIPV